MEQRRDDFRAGRRMRIVSVAMLDYVPRAGLATVPTSLRRRLGPHGRRLIFITRRNWITKLLIDRLCQANRYSRDELQRAFGAAGFNDITFKKFPPSYFRQNFWAHIVEAKRARS